MKVFGGNMLVLSLRYDAKTLGSYHKVLITITCKHQFTGLRGESKILWCIVLTATLILNVYGHMKLLEGILIEDFLEARIE